MAATCFATSPSASICSARSWQTKDDPACRDHYQTAYDLATRIGDTPGQAVTAGKLGNVYQTVTGLRDLDQAYEWHQRDLYLKPEHDHIGRALAHGNLAGVAYDRFRDARAAGAPTEQLLAYLEQARAENERSSDLVPDDHHDNRGNAHNRLGAIFGEVGDVPTAIGHFQQALHHYEALDDTSRAGVTRSNIAVLLGRNGRAGDALHYSRAALINFQKVGLGAAAGAAQAEQLIKGLEQLAAAPPSRPSAGYDGPRRSAGRRQPTRPRRAVNPGHS